MTISFISLFNITNGACPWLKQPIPCDFELYSSNRTLADSQKLLPNTDITGSKVLIVFMVTGFFAIFLSILMLLTDAGWLRGRWYHNQ